MAEVTTIRRFRNQAFTLATTTSSATTIRMENAAGGIISLGTVSTSAGTLQVFGCDEEDGVFARLYNSGGTAADITLSPSTTEGTMYALPDAAFALPYVKILSGDSNSDGVSGVIMLKS